MSSSSFETGDWFTRHRTGVWSGPIRWVGKGTLAVVDQGLISGSNFLLSIVLARWMRPEQYGLYTLAFSILLLMASFYQALFLEPMSLLGTSLYGDRKREYVGVLLRMHRTLGCFVCALGLLILVLGKDGGQSTNAIAGVMLATPFILLFWLARQASYLMFSSGLAATGAILYCVLLASGLALIFQKNLFSPFPAFLLMGGGTLAVSVFLLTQLKPEFKQRAGDPTVVEVSKRHWRYGRWELGTVMISWAAQNCSYALAGAVLGMSEVGALRAMINLILPVTQATAALRRMAQPYVSPLASFEGRAAIKLSIKTITLVCVIGGCAYCVLVSLFSGPIFDFLYGGKFKESAYLVPWLMLGLAISTGTHGFAVGLRAVQSPSSIFLVYCFSAAVNALVGIPATRIFGLPGLIAAGIAGSVTMMSVAALLFYRKVNVAAEAGNPR